MHCFPRMRKHLLIPIALLALHLAGNAQMTVGPAPFGPDMKVAAKVIRQSEHPCPKVVQAKRLSDGGIWARCSNGEEYLVASLTHPKHGYTEVALRCSVARAEGLRC